MTEPIEARVAVLEDTSREHQRELATLRAMDEYWERKFGGMADDLHSVKDTVDQHTARFDQHDARFDQIDKRFDDIEYLLRDILYRLPAPPQATAASPEREERA